MDKDRNKLLQNFRLPLMLVGVLWIIKIVETITGLNFGFFGVLPRDFEGLIGILTYPLIHGDFSHLINNSFPLIVLGFLMMQSYRKVAFLVIPFIWVASGLLVWLFARGNYHIGASGVVYGMAFFIAFSGIFRKDIKSVALAFLVAFLYGGMIWGVLPIKEGVSWEGHLFGAISGILCAYRYRNFNKPPKHEWNEEPEPDKYVEDPFWVKKEKPIAADLSEDVPNVEPIKPTAAPPKQNVDDELAQLKQKFKYNYVPKDPPKDGGS